MQQVLYCFFELLKSSLTGKNIKIPKLKDEEWNELFELSMKQSVAGLIADALQSQPKELAPYKPTLFKFIAIQNKIKNRNELVSHRTKEISLYFTSQGFKNCILKGQSVARLYPNPNSRCPGDIDLWVSGSPNEIIDFIRNRYDNIEYPTYLHIGIKAFDDVEVEVHFRPSRSFNPWINLKLQRFFRKNAEEQFNNSPVQGFNSPTIKFDAIYSLSHIFRHFIYNGIGIRQIVDYFFILRSLPVGDRKWVIENLSTLKMIRFFKATEWVLQKVLDLENEYLLCTPDEEFGRAIINEIIKTGNFGKYDKRMKISSHMRRFNARLSRQYQLVKYCPNEVLWMPIYYIKDFFNIHLSSFKRH